MRKSHASVGCILALLLVFGVGAPGCNTDFTLDTTLGELLDQITVGDVVAAFQQFVTQVDGEGGFGPRSVLTDEQLSQLEELQRQLDAGEITQEAFAEQVNSLIGDLAPHAAFGGLGFFGGPFGPHPHAHMASPLQLTEEQQAQARAIFEQLHADIQDLREQAHADIRAVLTEEQQATLDELRAGSRGLELPPGIRFRPQLPRPDVGQRFFDRLAEELGLSDEQIAEITQIREDLRSAIQSRHEQARDEFRSLLTEEQLAILDEIEARHDAHMGGEAS